MISILKLAAASLALGAVGLSYLATTPRVEATTAFAEVAQKLRDARTLSYRMLTQVPGQAAPASARTFYKDPGFVRNETDSPQALITISNMTLGKSLSLDPKSKVATLGEFKLNDDMKRRSQNPASKLTNLFRSRVEKNETPVGKRKIGKIEAEGFRVLEEGVAWNIWIDPEKKLPLLMETTFRFGDQDVLTTLSDIEINPQLDDALFRLDTPEGYKPSPIAGPVVLVMGEEALINMLRIYAEASGGTFPEKPTDPAVMTKFSKDYSKPSDQTKFFQIAQAFGPSMVFLQFELKDKYGYVPNQVKLGDANKVLLWYRPKGSEKYRAIFGDLHAEDVNADRLPETPKF